MRLPATRISAACASYVSHGASVSSFRRFAATIFALYTERTTPANEDTYTGEGAMGSGSAFRLRGGKPRLCSSVFLFVVLVASSTVAAKATSPIVTSGVLFDGRNSTAVNWRPCHGSIGQCDEEEMEWLIDSVAQRRLLAYIDYKSIRAVQDRKRKARSGKPYRRGCSRIYKCRNGGYRKIPLLLLNVRLGKQRSRPSSEFHGS